MTIGTDIINGPTGLGQPLAALGKPWPTWLFYTSKRAMDVIFAAVALLVTWPVFLVICILIKADSEGPVFYRQKRHGLYGATFEIIKFRTMLVNQENFIQCKNDDPRVTLLGKFLRKTSLDELPQLLNVLRGQMSLVGPRPHAVQHDQQLAEFVPHIMSRYVVKPGITGLAQVLGFRGPTDTAIAIQNRLAADLRYVETCSVWLDLKIMLLTVPVVLSESNAH